MFGRKDTTVIAVSKGNRDVEANRLKTNAMAVIIRFAAKERKDITVLEDDKMIIVGMPSEPGDTQWLMDNIFRYVDVLGANNDAEIDAKVQRLVDKAAMTDGFSPKMIGTGMMIKHLDMYYLLQMNASVFTRER